MLFMYCSVYFQKIFFPLKSTPLLFRDYSPGDSGPSPCPRGPGDSIDDRLLRHHLPIRNLVDLSLVHSRGHL